MGDKSPRMYKKVDDIQYLFDHYNKEIKELDNQIVENQKQNISLCVHPRFLKRTKA